MNRNEEWAALMSGLPDPPPALSDTVARARHRKARRFRGKLVGIPAASLAGVAAAFVLMVNLSLPFALAAGSVPGLKNLVAAVAFSPSLKAAVLNDYYRVSGQTQTQNGVTVSIQYLIADQNQVDVFYTAQTEDGRYLEVRPDLMQEDGVTPLHGYGATYAGPGETEGSLRHFSFLFVDIPVPDTLHLSCTVRSYEKNPAEAPVEIPEGMDDQPLLQKEEFLFHLPLNQEDIQTGETMEVGKDFTLDGQQITLDTVEINPTRAIINLIDHPDNTAWLKSLHFYLEDEEGNRYEPEGGITALGSDTPFFPTYFLESSYFQEAEHMNLVITGANWLDKDVQWLNGLKVGETYTDLPAKDFVSLEITRDGADILITLVTNQPSGFPHGPALTFSYRDGSGNEILLPSGEFSDLDHSSEERYRIENYSDDTIDLEVGTSRWTALDEPVVVPIR